MSGPTKPDFSVAEVLAAAGGALIGGRREVRIQGVSTDSRSIAPGNLFVALPGATFDGHDYLDQAASLGAGGLLVQRWDGRDRGALPTLLVPDTVRALGDLAAAWRRRFALPVAALSGSAGKTTTKEMTALILEGDRLVLKTAGNQNNLIGLPLTLFRLHARHEAAVLELGTNRPGEIARLASIACPDAALITNVGPAHLEGLGSLEGVAREKGDLFAHMKERGVAVVNGDDPRVRALNTSRAGQVVTFGLEGKPDVTARHLRDDDVGGIRFDLAVSGEVREVRLAVSGRHSVYNALAAAALAHAVGAGMDALVRGLEQFRPVAGRMEIITLNNGAFVINDTYNANPASVAEALTVLAAMKGSGRALAVLGDMLELGEEGGLWHRRVGGLLAGKGLALAFLRGRFAGDVAAGAMEKGMPPESLVLLETNREIVDRLCPQIGANDWILVKGSRGMKMEEVVEGLLGGVSRKTRAGAGPEGGTP